MIKLHYTTDLLCGVFQTNLPMLFASGEKSAHSLTIQLREGREPAAIHSQTVKAYFIRSDKSTVFWSGSISGSTVSVTMKESCYVQPGGFSLIIMIGDEDDRTAVFWGVGTVVRSATDSLVDPGGQIPSLEALLAMIGTIEAATDAAHEATTAANSAAGAANTAAGQANAAASTATTAAGQATSAAGAAHASATTADAAAGNANEAAAVATDAARAIEEMTVAASSLPAGSNPTAEISDVDGHKHVAFGIPTGQTGPKGDTGATPDISIGTVTTGAPGTEASATMTGTSESPVLNLTIPRGDPGGLDNIPWYTDTPSAAGQASPGTSDQVARGDHVHPMPTAAQVGARSKDWLPDGLIYPTTAQALETMSQEQQAALYQQGYRSIVATYNDTVTMHALAEDGSLAWIGCNRDTTNLIINPDFAIAQSGYGGTHGTRVYAADMWYAENALTISRENGIVSIANPDESSLLVVVQNSDADFVNSVSGKSLTLAICLDDDTVACGTGVIPSVPVFETVTPINVKLTKCALSVALFSSGAYQLARFMIFEGRTVAFKWIRLIEGSYTAKTLPPWVAPDPVMELIKCQNYFRPFPKAAIATIDSPTGVNARATLDPPMRNGVNPTVTMTTGATAKTTSGEKNVTISYQGVTSPGDVSYVFHSAEALTQGTPAIVTGINGWISSDL